MTKNQGKVMSKNPVGAPPKYYPEICAELIEYFDSEIFKIDADGKREVQEPRTIQRFLFSKRIPRSTFYDWKKNYQELSDTLELCQMQQAHNALAGSMMGVYNPMMSKFLVINISDYSDKVDHNHESKDGSMSPVFNFTEKK